MATTKGQVRKALMKGDSLENLVCFYQDYKGADVRHEKNPPPVKLCMGSELPVREFRDGLGGPEGEPCICFSKRFVYIKVRYDGAEWVEAIPRHPEQVGKSIPWPGGGG